MDGVFHVESISIEDREAVEEGFVSDQDTELIKWVQLNEVLWNNKHPNYRDSGLRANTWASVGLSLRPPMTGEEAQKRFKGLRTVFGRHYEAVRDNQPRSGAGAGPIHVPKWPLNKDLLFLTDVISPRATKTNFQRVSPAGPGPKKAKVSPRLSASVDMQAPTCSRFLTPSGPVRSLLQPHLDAHPVSASPPPRRDSTDSSSIVLERSPWLSDVVNNDSDNESVSSATTCGTTSTTTYAPATPPPDNFYKAKKAEDARGTKALVELSGVVKDFVTTIKQSHPPGQSASPAANVSPHVEGALLLVRGSLERIHPSLQLECVSQLISVLKTFEDRSKDLS